MFEATTRENGEATIVNVRGEVDMEVAPDLWDVIERAIEEGRPIKVLLADVTYMDSSGIATLIRGLKHAQGRGVRYALVDPSRRVRDVLELAQLDRLFTIETGA